MWLFSRTSQVFSKTSILFVTPQTFRTKTSINICDQICEKGCLKTDELLYLELQPGSHLIINSPQGRSTELQLQWYRPKVTGLLKTKVWPSLAFSLAHFWAPFLNCQPTLSKSSFAFHIFTSGFSVCCEVNFHTVTMEKSWCNGLSDVIWKRSPRWATSAGAVCKHQFY